MKDKIQARNLNRKYKKICRKCNRQLRKGEKKYCKECKEEKNREYCATFTGTFFNKYEYDDSTDETTIVI